MLFRAKERREDLGGRAQALEGARAGLQPARPEPADNPMYRRAFVGRESGLRQLTST